MAKINFFSENIDFQLPDKQKIRQWLTHIVENHQYKITEINYIFCDDTYLHQINLEYLQHNTLTDIITFDNSEKAGRIESDIFISIERVRENAQKFNTDFTTELLRVMAHGVLHLLGFKDKTPPEKDIMRAKEAEALSEFSLMLHKKEAL